MKRIIAVLASVVLLLGCSKSPEEKMIHQLKQRAEINKKENIESIEFQILSIDTLDTGGIFYDAKVKTSVKHKAFDKAKEDTVMVMFSNDFIIID